MQEEEKRRSESTTVRGYGKAAMGYDRMKEVKEFDDTKTGVKGLADSGITTIPKFFVLSPEYLANPETCSDSIQIPIIDLLGVNTNRKQEIIDHVSTAAREWGFFQIVNHTIPLSTMNASLSAVRSFHEQPQEIKKQHYDRGKAVAYVANNDLFRSKAASWRDSLLVKLDEEQPEIDQIPEICRKEVVEWSEHARGIGELLMELLSEGLGLGAHRLKKINCFSKWILVGQCYPHCPEPELTMGIPSHTDKGVLTIVVQDQIGGLQVRKGDVWVPVRPLTGALVINIGDFLQVISNGIYKSVEHRVLANPFPEPRNSVVVFLNASEEGDESYGPLEELVSPSTPALYRNFTISEMKRIFATKELIDISLPREFKL